MLALVTLNSSEGSFLNTKEMLRASAGQKATVICHSERWFLSPLNGNEGSYICIKEMLRASAGQKATVICHSERWFLSP